MKTKEIIRPIEKYFESHDTKYLAEDAVFINMETNELTIGKEAIGNMLNYIYHIAFDAYLDKTNSIVTDDKALLEGIFTGKHIGDFAGISATNKTVKVPLCVSYDLEENLIKVARVYMLSSTMIEQLTS